MHIFSNDDVFLRQFHPSILLLAQQRIFRDIYTTSISKRRGDISPPQTHSLFPFVSSLFFYYFYLTLDIYIYTTESANVLSFNGPGSALTEWSAFDFFYCSHIYSPFSLFFRGRKGFSRHGNQMGKNTFNTNVPMKDRLRANKRRTRQFHFSSFLFLSVGFSHFNFLR